MSKKRDRRPKPRQPWKRKEPAAESPALAGRDPRYLAIAPAVDPPVVVHVAAVVPMGDRLVMFGVPAPSALCLSIAHRAWKRSEDALRRELFAANIQTEPKDPGAVFDVLEDRLENIVFSYTAIELFANVALPEDYTHRKERDDGRCTEEYSRAQVERSFNLKTKLDAVLPGVRGVQSPKGTLLWERLAALEKLRDRVVHLKWADVRRASPTNDTIWRELIATVHEDYSVTAHDVISHFCMDGNRQRWIERFPYPARRP